MVAKKKSKKVVKKPAKKSTKKIAKKHSKKPAKKSAKIKIKTNEKVIGKVSHFFDKISVAVIELTGTIKVGDKIAIRGNTTNFEQKVESMQLEHVPVKEAKRGQGIGLKVKEQVRLNDLVYVLS